MAQTHRNKHSIYLDYAAATPAAPSVMTAMAPYFSMQFANPSSLHYAGSKAGRALATARATLASNIGAQPHEIIFTSGGTESINLALQGTVAAIKKHQHHCITTTIEHAATLKTFEALRQQDHRITSIPCSPDGIVDTKKIIDAITPTTTLVSIIYVQNEIGTIQPVEEIGKALVRVNRKRIQTGMPRILFHIDACQAPLWIRIDVEKLHADLLSLDASKMYGPKGVGLLYIRRGVKIAPILFGGGQEQGLRAGTEPVALIVGFATALHHVTRHNTKESKRVARLRDSMMQRLEKEIVDCKITGNRTQRIPNNVHVTLPNREGEDLVLRLDRAGIAASTGSACSSAESTESHVMKALQLPANRIAGSLRFSLGYQTTQQDIDTAVTALKKIIRNNRSATRSK